MTDDQLPVGSPMGWTPVDPAPVESTPTEGTAPLPADPTDLPGAADPAYATDPWAGLSTPQTDSAADDPGGAGIPPLLSDTASAPGGAIGPDGWTAPPVAPRKRRLLSGRIIGLIVIIAIVAGGAIGRDFLSSNASDLRLGDCFDDSVTAAGTTGVVKDVQHHPCSEPHLFEVFAVLQFAADKGAPFPGNSGFDTFVNDKCAAAFATYVGIADTDSKLNWSDYQPTEDGWNKGDREITCFLGNADLTKRTGTAKDSKL